MSGAETKRLPPGRCLRPADAVDRPEDEHVAGLTCRATCRRRPRIGGEQHVGIALHDEVVGEEDAAKEGAAVRVA